MAFDKVQISQSALTATASSGNKETEHSKKTSVWNARNVSIAVVGGVALLVCLACLYESSTLYKSAADNEKLPISKMDYACPNDAGELYRYGSSTFTKGFDGDNPACIISVLAPICKRAIEQLCQEKGDTCTNVEVTSVSSEQRSDMLCYAKAQSDDCQSTFSPEDENSTFWLSLKVKNFDGWENNPIVKWAVQSQIGRDEGAIAFKTDVRCSKV